MNHILLLQADAACRRNLTGKTTVRCLREAAYKPEVEHPNVLFA